MRQLDEYDRRIIEALRKDGRVSYRSLASIVGISNVAVRDRVSKLVKRGYIKGFFALADSRLIGKDVSAIFEVEANTNEFSEVVERISRCEEVTKVYEKVGAPTIFVHACFRNIDEMQNFAETVYKIKGVVRVISSMIYRRHKFDPSLDI
ncbi:MAG: Lrp/AsnC family transcriptional regulator [Candidatus Verstraetearchaeota archaeon]|nr:Lrp/AsnC family transcriptional regulator [Candidatus Verstraetearchaeota archaeon]